ncbi:MAG TPA: hypothetical protein VI796_06050 [Candidatus Thermoplasmatota archaeon]|nr:hypothetical protein [Candidatus Thermoplasmatota archaeon]
MRPLLPAILLAGAALLALPTAAEQVEVAVDLHILDFAASPPSSPTARSTASGPSATRSSTGGAPW